MERREVKKGDEAEKMRKLGAYISNPIPPTNQTRRKKKRKIWLREKDKAPIRQSSSMRYSFFLLLFFFSPWRKTDD